MNVSLVITNTKRKSLGFIVDVTKSLSSGELIDEIQKGIYEKIYIVTGTSGTYIRSSPDATAGNNIDELSVSGLRLLKMLQGYVSFTSPVTHYIKIYTKLLKEIGPYIEPVGNFRVPRDLVKKVFQSHSSIIKKASQEFEVDRSILGAILIDEIARLIPFETILEKVGVEILGRGMTVGVAQVSLDTANGLIAQGLYNPNPRDRQLPFAGGLTNKDRKVLYTYVVKPEHCIRFAAALIRSFIDEWSTVLDISDRPDVIGTLYSRKAVEPSTDPEIKPRGQQIADEFYHYAKQWLT